MHWGVSARRVGFGIAMVGATIVIAISWSRYVPSLDDTGPSPPLLTASTLSVLRAVGAECAWSRHDPIAKTDVVLYRLPSKCEGIQISWSSDGRRALVGLPHADGAVVWHPMSGMDSDDSDQPPKRLIEIAITSGKSREVPIPPVGIGRIGYHFSTGEPIAVPRSGSPWTLGRFGWRQIVPRAGDDDDLAALAPRSASLLGQWPGDVRWTETGKHHKEGFVVTPNGVRIAASGWQHGAVMKGPIQFTDASGVVVLGDRSPSGWLSGEEQEAFLLVFESTTGRKPRLYDVRTHALAYWSDTDRAMFWPMPRSPSSAPPVQRRNDASWKRYNADLRRAIKRNDGPHQILSMFSFSSRTSNDWTRTDIVIGDRRAELRVFKDVISKYDWRPLTEQELSTVRETVDQAEFLPDYREGDGAKEYRFTRLVRGGIETSIEFSNAPPGTEYTDLVRDFQALRDRGPFERAVVESRP